MDNAAELMSKKVAKLRERMQKAKDNLVEIDGIGKEMDGNTSHVDEDEFIDALKDEMPEVFVNVENHFQQLDQIEQVVKEVDNTKSVAAM
jgi:division protein CdvB (Snf7/Vps24/ESCRT-III family)